MTLQFRNTLGGELEPFEPLDPADVRMYSCGPTVYAPAHVGQLPELRVRGPGAPVPGLEGLRGHAGS